MLPYSYQTSGGTHESPDDDNNYDNNEDNDNDNNKAAIFLSDKWWHPRVTR
jgi:hypothetical protein